MFTEATGRNGRGGVYYYAPATSTRTGFKTHCLRSLPKAMSYLSALSSAERVTLLASASAPLPGAGRLAARPLGLTKNSQ